jgi:hypothetical protein
MRGVPHIQWRRPNTHRKGESSSAIASGKDTYALILSISDATDEGMTFRAIPCLQILVVSTLPRCRVSTLSQNFGRNC